jgi:hypothetical protein
MPICLAVVRSAMICHCWELRTVRRLHMASCATEFRLVLTWVFSPYDFLSLCQRFEETCCNLSLSFVNWRNGNRLSTITRRPPVGPKKGRFFLLHSLPNPSLNCFKAPYLSVFFLPYPFSLFGTLFSVSLPQTLYKPSTSQLCRFSLEDGDSIRRNHAFGLCLSSHILKNTTFRKLYVSFFR